MAKVVAVCNLQKTSSFGDFSNFPIDAAGNVNFVIYWWANDGTSGTIDNGVTTGNLVPFNPHESIFDAAVLKMVQEKVAVASGFDEKDIILVRDFI